MTPDEVVLANDLLVRLSRLEKVLEYLNQPKCDYYHLTAGRYARDLPHEKSCPIDREAAQMIVSASIDAARNQLRRLGVDVHGAVT